ncbi:ATP-dependent helicase [Clostridia bacterium]|nr:ATP-dependent helicase [Clostridia bacterium]
MANSIVDNIFLVNAPAGSGKTYKIRSMVTNHSIEFPEDNILCITYTNRAAEELNKDLNNPKIHISTIHSFLNDFIGVYFSHQDILKLYFKFYSNKIKKRIENIENEDHINNSNQKYIEKYGSLDYDTLKSNITSLSYNETAFNSLYYGGLSHDDLIVFSKVIFDNFTVIKKRLSQKFQAIFIDEYQDASADILKIFYNATLNTPSKLYLLGDKMQQIYKNYDGTFEKQLSSLNTTISLTTNHRSISEVIDILNKLYNDPSFVQVPSSKNIDIKPDHNPRVIICNDIEKAINQELNCFPNALCLYLLNQKKFDSIGCGNLYRTLNRLERYSHVQKYSASDILTDFSNENPDPILRVFFIIAEISDYYNHHNLGKILQLFKQNHRIFNAKIYEFKSHDDKKRLSTILEKVITQYLSNDVTNKLETILSCLLESNLIRTDYLDPDYEIEYSNVLDVKFSEFKAILNYLKSPNISTQHGVKGESHDTVFFIAENSNRIPVVHMYKFFELWSTNDISLTTFESFYYEYCKWINETNTELGFQISDITPELHAEKMDYLVSRVNSLLSHYSDNQYFQLLCEKDYTDYLSRPNKTRVIKCFKESVVYGSLSAYRLFYVGCSRSRRNLTIFISETSISNYKQELIDKLNKTGFSVIDQ